MKHFWMSLVGAALVVLSQHVSGSAGYAMGAAGGGLLGLVAWKADHYKHEADYWSVEAHHLRSEWPR